MMASDIIKGYRSNKDDWSWIPRSVDEIRNLLVRSGVMDRSEAESIPDKMILRLEPLIVKPVPVDIMIGIMGVLIKKDQDRQMDQHIEKFGELVGELYDLWTKMPPAPPKERKRKKQ